METSSRMSGHHTKSLGDLGVLKAQLDLYQKGFVVSVPLTEHAPFDLVISRDGNSRTVQVKSRHLSDAGTVEIKFRSCWSDRTGTHYKPRSRDHADLYCVYNPESDTCFYFDPGKFNRSVTLRVRAPKNGQSKNVHFLADFREVP